MKIYNKLKVKKWKDKIPEIGHFTGFRKNKISDPKNPEYIKSPEHTKNGNSDGIMTL